MSITIFAVICALLTVFTLVIVYGIFAIRRKNGKSDIRHSRIVLVIASFIIPILVTGFFVFSAIIAQLFYQYEVPVGKRGGGVFIVLLTSVVASVLTLILLLPAIKHKWKD